MNKQLSLLKILAVSLLGVAALLFVLQISAVSAAQEIIPFADREQAANSAVQWLVAAHQNEDGGFTSFSTGADQAESDIAGTIDAIQAIGSAGADTSRPIAYLVENIDLLAAYALTDGSTAGKTTLALIAAGEDPRDFGGFDFVISISSQISLTGQYKVNTAFNQSLAILGLAEAGEPVPDNAVDWLIGQQATTGELAGSWDDGFGTSGNADATAMSVLALVASGRSAEDESVAMALDFLSRTQLPSGGWEYGAGFGENTNSIALVIQALAAVGEDISTVDSSWRQDGITPAAALMAWQSESGAFQADFGEGRTDDFFSTVQSAPALTAVPAIEESSSAIAGGDSPLPFIVVGVVLLIIAIFSIWYLRKGRV